MDLSRQKNRQCPGEATAYNKNKPTYYLEGVLPACRKRQVRFHLRAIQISM